MLPSRRRPWHRATPSPRRRLLRQPCARWWLPRLRLSLPQRHLRLPWHRTSLRQQPQQNRKPRRLLLLLPQRPHPLRAVSSCRRLAPGPSIPRRWHPLRQRLQRHKAQVVFSADAPSLIVARAVVRPRGLPVDMERPALGVPCTRRAARRAAHLRERVPDSASGPVWDRVPALDSVQAALEVPALCRLPAKRHVRSVPVRVSAAAARHTRRPRKAR
jgi:hypothetical protein